MQITAALFEGGQELRLVSADGGTAIKPVMSFW